MNLHVYKKLLLVGLCLPTMLITSSTLLASSIDAVSNAVIQENTVKGVVVDKDGLPIIGANVIEKGTTNGVITDLNGGFELNLSLHSVLQVSYIGYITQEITIKDKAELNIVLREDSEALDEVVVVGYGVMKKSDLTGAVSSINEKKLKTMPASNAIEALQGKIAGVEIGSVTEPGLAPSILIRGNRSINASNSPLYVVDGIPRDEINDIPVSDIDL